MTKRKDYNPKKEKETITTYKHYKGKIGEVFETGLLHNKCKCGEIVTQQLYFYVKEGEDIKNAITEWKKEGRDVYLGLCKCGNIFKC